MARQKYANKIAIYDMKLKVNIQSSLPASFSY